MSKNKFYTLVFLKFDNWYCEVASDPNLGELANIAIELVNDNTGFPLSIKTHDNFLIWKNSPYNPIKFKELSKLSGKKDIAEPSQEESIQDYIEIADRVEAENDSLRETIDALKSSISSYQSTIKHLNRQKKELKTQVFELRNELYRVSNTPKPPDELLEQLRMFMGVYPHDNWSNILFGDGIFYDSLKSQYPADVFTEAEKLIQHEKDIVRKAKEDAKKSLSK